MLLFELLLKPVLHFRRQCREDHRFQMRNVFVLLMPDMGDIPPKGAAFFKLALDQIVPLFPVAYKRLPGFLFILIFCAAMLSGQVIPKTAQAFFYSRLPVFAFLLPALFLCIDKSLPLGPVPRFHS